MQKTIIDVSDEAMKEVYKELRELRNQFNKCPECGKDKILGHCLVCKEAK